jgi:hypothetical protein
MRIDEKLDIALYGCNMSNPAAVFTYIWNSVGLPVKIEDVAKILPLTENRRNPDQERTDINKLIQTLRAKLSRSDLNQITDQDIKRILTQQFGYKGNTVERLSDIIIDVLPEYEQIESPEGPGPDELDLETLRKFKRLEDVEQLEKPQPVPHEKPVPKEKKFEVKYDRGGRAKSRIPSSFKKKLDKVPSQFRPGYVTHQRALFNKPDAQEKMRRAREILKRK